MLGRKMSSQDELEHSLLSNQSKAYSLPLDVKPRQVIISTHHIKHTSYVIGAHQHVMLKQHSRFMLYTICMVPLIIKYPSLH